MNFVEKCQKIADELGLEIESYKDGNGKTDIYEDDGILHCTEGEIRVAFFLEQDRPQWSRVKEKQIRKALNREETGEIFKRNRTSCKNMNWLCKDQTEANLADAIFAQGKLNGVDENDIRFIFIHTLRMLKANSDWV